MASEELNRIVTQIDLDKGLARTILKDTVISDQFKEIIGNLREGTILLNQNMEAMKSNFLFRGYYKKQERKKRKEDKPTS
jgi:phospholipid/cholesterol/gamma-HCH transport system substrate-binding protein